MIDVMLLMMRTVCTVYKHTHTYTFKFGFKTCLDADVLCKRDEKERNYNLERFTSSEENLGQQVVGFIVWGWLHNDPHSYFTR